MMRKLKTPRSVLFFVMNRINLLLDRSGKGQLDLFPESCYCSEVKIGEIR